MTGRLETSASGHLRSRGNFVEAWLLRSGSARSKSLGCGDSRRWQKRYSGPGSAKARNVAEGIAQSHDDAMTKALAAVRIR